VGFFGGDILLKDLIFRPKKINEIFEKQNLPFALKAGMIAKLEIKVSSSSLPFQFLTILNDLLSLDLCLEALLRVNIC